MEKIGNNFRVKVACRLSYGLVFGVLLASLCGLAQPDIYAKETPSWAAQGLGQDAVDLFLVGPLLWLSARGVRKGRKVHLFLLAGTLVYLAYSFVLYAFCVHFNRLFFLYCAALGFSVYALILLASGFSWERAAKWFDQGRSIVFPAVYFLTTALLFYLLWFAEDLPAVLRGTAPPILEVAGLCTNPVHVLDLSLVLPAMLIASVQLLRRKPSGYLLFPALMVFSVVMAVAITGMALVLWLKGLAGDGTVALVFGLMALLNSAVLAFFFRALKKTKCEAPSGALFP